MIVVSRRTDIVKTGQVFAVVCSTEFVDPSSEEEVLLPSHEEGRSVTKLRKPTVAVCDWTTTLALGEVQGTGGLVPIPLLREICGKAKLPFISER